MFIATRSNTQAFGKVRKRNAGIVLHGTVLSDGLTANQADLKSSESIEFVIEKIALLFNSRATMHVISAMYIKTQFDPELFSGYDRPN